MEQHRVAQTFVNLMAQAFQQLVQENESLRYIEAVPCFDKIADHVKKQISLAQTASDLLSTITQLISEMHGQTEAQCAISYAKAISLCMDQKISYYPFSTQLYENGQISLHPLIPIWSDKNPCLLCH